MKKADIKNGLREDYTDVDKIRDYEQEREDDNALQTHINLIGGAEYGV